MKNEKIMAFFGLLFFLPSLVFAQGASFWSGLYSVIFIIAFILLLLAVGGVLKWPKIGRSSSLGKWVSLIVFVILIFGLPYIIYNYLSEYFPTYTEVPENFKLYPLPSYASMVLKGLGLPDDWMYVPAIIYLFIIPFTGIYVIVLAFLKAMGIFKDNTNRLLALLITFLTIPVGWFVRLVWLMFAAMGIWSVVVFAVMFFAGVFFKGFSTVKKGYYESGLNSLESRVKELKRKLQNLLSSNLGPAPMKEELKNIYYQYRDIPAIAQYLTPTTIDGVTERKELEKIISQILKQL